MFRIRRSPHVLLSICLCLFLVSCSKKSEETGNYSIAMPLDRMGISEHGILTVIDDVLWFYDFESGNKVVLCNRPNCTHKPFSWDTNPEPTCHAVLPNGDAFDAVSMYNDHVYIFSNKINHTIVYQANLDGSGREVIAEFDWQIYEFDHMTFKDNQAFFIAVQEILDEEGQPINHDRNYIVMSLDLATGKTTEWTEIKRDHYANMYNLKVYDNRLYYNYVYFDDEMDWSDETIERMIDYMNSFLYEVEFSTKQEKLVMDLGNAEEGLFIGMDENRLYFESRDQTKAIAVRLQDLTVETLFEGSDISIAPLVGDGLFYKQYNNSNDNFYYYDFSTKKTMTIQRPSEREEGFPIFTYEDWIITLAKLDDGEYHKVGIKIDDYLDGKNEYHFINKISNADG